MRRGTSLMEVLVAIMVMSIGILGVMALFPVAIARSIQATSLTNATIVSKRADALIDMFGLTSDLFIPQPVEGHVTHAVIDPLGWHDMATVNGSFAQEFGNDGTDPVRYRPPIVQNQLAAPRFVGIGRDVLLTNSIPSCATPSDRCGVPLRRLGFAVDPIGPYSAITPQEPTDPDYRIFQNPIPLSGADRLAARDTVLNAVSLPDHFDEAFSDTPDPILTQRDNSGRITAVGFSGPANDLSHLQTARMLPGTRVTLIDTSGTRSQLRDFPSDGLTIEPNGGDWIVSWDQPLPDGFSAISDVQIAFPGYRYTWILTVRKRGISGGSISEIDCVTFLNRPTGDPSQERVLEASQPSPDAGRPNVPPGDIIDVTYADKPTIKKGGWVFDPQHCLWYHVTDILNETPTAARLQLDRSAEEWIQALIFPDGVINVFPLPSRVDQKRLDNSRRIGRR